MPDPRFFTVGGPFTLKELAEIAGAEMATGADPDRTFADIAPLDDAGAADASFLDNRKYVSAFEQSAAGACVVEPKFAELAPKGMALLLTDRPYRAYARLAQAFYPEEQAAPGLHESAVIDPSASLGPDCRVEVGAVIGPGAKIGARCWIGANAVVGPSVVIGDDTVVGACASLSHCLVGARVRVHPGVRIGQRGFGFAMDVAGHIDVPQLGRVIVGDDVEIGANSAIDRGAVSDTVVGAGSRIDNLVQIGHNVRLGRGCVIVAQVGISGSTVLEDNVIIAGQGGVAGHLRLGEGCQIGAQSGVLRDVPAGAKMLGYPAVPMRRFLRQVVTLERLAKKKGS